MVVVNLLVKIEGVEYVREVLQRIVFEVFECEKHCKVEGFKELFGDIFDVVLRFVFNLNGFFDVGVF